MSETPRLIQSIVERGGRAEKVAEFATGDGLIAQIYAVVDGRGRPKIFVIKMAENGFVKKAVQFAPSDVEKLIEALKQAKEKLKELI